MKKRKKKPDVLAVPLFGTKLIAGGAVRSAAAWKEAAASVSLDGDTQSCEACNVLGCLVHTCGRREMTEAERRVVEAALAWDADDAGYDRRLQLLEEACKALRAERKT